MAIIKPVKGLTRNTQKIFETISRMDCLNALFLCGGTAISVQLSHRLSEDLDFELIGTAAERPPLSFGTIINEINALFPGARKEILGSDHFMMLLPGNVKLSFFRPRNPVPSLRTGYRHNNIKTPILQELLGMKIFTTTVRNTYRDYYDIYCLLKEDLDLEQGIRYAISFSRHTIHTKQIITNLTTPQLYIKEKDFDKLYSTRYNVSSEEINELIRLKFENIGEKFKIQQKFESKEEKSNTQRKP